MPPPAEGIAARLVLGPALRAQPDRRLVALVREGYESAFGEIVRRYGGQLTRYAAAIVGSRGEDVTQDAFAKALLALKRDGAEIELRPWLFRIVRNTALNDLRDNPAPPEALAEAIAGGRDPAEEAERREELAELIRQLRALPEPQRAAIVMRELEGLGHAEIAAALGLSGGAARQAIHRARQALRDGLGLLLPLPLLRALIEHGGEVAAAGAGAGGATVAAGAGGAGVALKAGVVTAVLAGSVGTGIAVRESRDRSEEPAAAGATQAIGAAAAERAAGQPVAGGGSVAAAEAARDGGRQDRGEGPRRDGGTAGGGHARDRSAGRHDRGPRPRGGPRTGHPGGGRQDGKRAPGGGPERERGPRPKGGRQLLDDAGPERHAPAGSGRHGGSGGAGGAQEPRQPGGGDPPPEIEGDGIGAGGGAPPPSPPPPPPENGANSGGGERPQR